MFEDSLVESRGRLASKSRRWITAGSVGLQCLIAAGFVLVPILRPEALPFRTMAPVVVVPLLKKPPVLVEPKHEMAAHSTPGMAAPSMMAATRVAVLPSMHPVDTELATGVAVPSSLVGMGGSGNGSALFGSAETSATRVTVAAPKKTGPLTVSSGVSSGMLLGKIEPVYPRIAIAARVEGVVIIEATISKSGTIKSARAVSGPAMLRGAAIEAVERARYRPYRLNDEATEVQTTVTVNFKLGS